MKSISVKVEDDDEKTDNYGGIFGGNLNKSENTLS